ncbi:protein lifeguard 4-like [Saccostrea echinata]|uniref:protein lifeguard 4-like n=1 Tax=Saccostrea echinata TaxID=191078 RepID=UPI002A7F8011|nr:protein lifeguard 4-like [Saccostrea echinata]XP_061187845.1 protein lifeguard 4-like [Saccostrea echinata]
MATKPSSDEFGKHSIVDDFMYGSNVATAHVYIRMGFLRKVYGILSTQLLLTTIVGFLFMSSETVTNYVQQSPWMLLVAMIGSIGLVIALMVYKNQTPTNYVLLGLFTMFEAYCLGTIVTFYKVHSVLEAFLMTLVVAVSLTMYTLQSKKDFSSWGAGLFACLLILIFAGLLQLFFPTVLMDRLIAAGGALLFSLFIIFDTSMMMHKLSPEDYIVASVNLYLDVINLFLHLLRLMGERK